MAAARDEMDDLRGYIQNLPHDLREMILKEYISNKIKERSDLGFSCVHYEIGMLPFCEENQRITKVTSCGKVCCFWKIDLCNLCLKNGKRHIIGRPVFHWKFHNCEVCTNIVRNPPTKSSDRKFTWHFFFSASRIASTTCWVICLTSFSQTGEESSA